MKELWNALPLEAMFVVLSYLDWYEPMALFGDACTYGQLVDPFRVSLWRFPMKDAGWRTSVQVRDGKFNPHHFD